LSLLIYTLSFADGYSNSSSSKSGNSILSINVKYFVNLSLSPRAYKHKIKLNAVAKSGAPSNTLSYEAAAS